MKSAETHDEQPLTSLPKIISCEEWQRARDQFLIKEKAATKARDALSAERRRLAMVRIEKDYVFEGLGGKVRLLDLFESRRQLIVACSRPAARFVEVVCIDAANGAGQPASR